MSEGLTRNAARNIFYGGSAIFFLIFAGLTLHTNYYMANTSTAKYELSESVIKGKEVWEEHSCINCHTIMGEGAYFAPELSNVWHRYGGRENPQAARAGIKGVDEGPAHRCPGSPANAPVQHQRREPGSPGGFLPLGRRDRNPRLAAA